VLDVLALNSSVLPAPMRRQQLPPSLPVLPPMRVLLVEDNTVNQRVAQRLLQKLGQRADIAGNGMEALVALRRQDYDVVLMDAQMPEMDGYQATAAIRSRIPAARQPRIIAMTANALEGDREKCLAAGMDDYLTKPIEPALLAAALAASVKPEPAPEDFSANGLKELRRMLDEDGALDVLTALIDEIPANRRDLEEGLARSDVRTLTRLAHTLRGTSQLLQANALGQAFGDAEALLALGGDLGPLAQRLPELLQRYVALVQRARAELPS
jgi:CheY-like chemotaxis protein/HPt (histidine-containing phosphotransfer) domain-containing protein